MNEHMSALRDALYNYIEAVEIVLAKCYASGNHETSGRTDLSWDFAMANLKHAHDIFHSASKEASKFHVQISKQPVGHQSKEVAPDVAKLACLSLNDAQLRDLSVPLVKDHNHRNLADILEEDMLEYNHGDMADILEEDMLEHNHGDLADILEGDMTVLLLASEDLDTYLAELEEILEHNHDLPDLDPKQESLY